jgi:hypothetical protein
MGTTRSIPKKGKPFSITLAVLAPDNKRQVSFGMTRDFQDNGEAFFLIDFVLRDKSGDTFQERVKLRVTVGDQNTERAKAVMERGLTMTQLEFLKGPITNRAKALPPGTTDDKKLSELNEKLLSVK